jgi:hypothetical protein
MRPTLLKDTLKSLFPVQRNVCIEGPPGGGKTTIVHEVARELNAHYIEVHMPTMLVEDFGVMFPENGSSVMTYRLPHWYPAKGSKYDDGRGIFLCFDDRNQGGNDLQKVQANIMQARTLHGAPLADKCMVVSTGNRQSDRAGSNRVLSHVRDRETVFELETHLDDWTAWAVDHQVRPEVLGFIRFRPNLLHDFDPQRDVNASPRSWVEGVSQIMGVVPHEAEYEAFKGAVGEGAAAEFVGFLRIHRKLPDPDKVLANPSVATVPDEKITLYALCSSLAHRATVKNVNNFVEYITRLPGEFSVLSMTLACRRDGSLTNTKAFTSWAVDHQDLLF